MNSMMGKINCFIESKVFRLLLLTVFFISLIIFRQRAGIFGISIGYMYVLLISLAGFWFGVKGGVVAAILSCGIFIYEVNVFGVEWEVARSIKRGMALRFITYFLSGITLGFLATVDKKLRLKLEGLVSHDELTNCLNYRWTMNRLEAEIDRASRYKKYFSIAMLDVDHFKNINDVYGHLYGNRVLQIFSDFIRKNIRNIDIFGRYGGDEFILIFPEIDSSQALLGLKRIKKEMQQLDLKIKGLKGKEDIEIKFSAGVASFPHNAQNLNDLLSFADSSLYRAKVAGRDKVFSERRRWIRVKGRQDLKIEILDTSGKGNVDITKVENISQRGMLIVFNKDLIGVGEEFLCKIKFPREDEGENTPFLCKVVNKRSGKDMGRDFCCAGIYFAEIPEADEKKLKELVNKAFENNES